MTTLRAKDYQAETAVAGFLNLHFYPKYVQNLLRYTDQAHQFKGIDVQFDYQEQKHIWVDEKAATHYVNKNLPTFAFELNFLGRDGKLKKGWFYDATKHTEYYLLSWVWATKEKGFTTADITKLEIVLVRRRSIIEMLRKEGLSPVAAQQLSTTIRNNKQTGVSHKEYAKPYYFYFTGHLAEQPINLIIRKQKLIELSLLHCVVEAN